LLFMNFLEHMGNNLYIEIRLTIKFEYFLPLAIEYTNENIDSAKLWQLDDLLEQASFSLGESALTLNFTVDALKIFKIGSRFHGENYG
jgi:hypothetical protein